MQDIHVHMGNEGGWADRVGTAALRASVPDVHPGAARAARTAFDLRPHVVGPREWRANERT